MRWIKTRASLSVCSVTVHADRLPYDDERRGWRVRDGKRARDDEATAKRPAGCNYPQQQPPSGCVGSWEKGPAQRRVGEARVQELQTGVKRTQVHVRQFLTAGPWQVGSRGRGVAVRGEEGERERVVTNERKVESRAAGEYWTERNTHGLNETNTRTGSRRER